MGPPGWYLTRPGFWHGAIGPAACWAGGALSLIDAVRSLDRQGPHARAQLGALEALAWNLETILDQAGREIDQDPADSAHGAKRRALICRHLIERQAVEVMDRFGRASGPQLLAFDEFAARQYAGLTIYVRQCHAEKDDEAIAARAGPSEGSSRTAGGEVRLRPALSCLAGLVWRRLCRSLRPGGVRPPGQVVGEVCKCVFERFAAGAGRLSGFVQGLGDRADGQAARCHDHAHLGQDSVPAVAERTPDNLPPE